MTGGTTAAALPMSNHTRERVTVAKLTLENFYSTLLTQHEEREMRWAPPDPRSADARASLLSSY